MEDTGSEGSSSIIKTVPVIRDLSLNPCCAHGPTILFDRNGSRFFVCSAYRSRKLCPFYLTEKEWESIGKQKDEQSRDKEEVVSSTRRKRGFAGEEESDGKSEASKKKKLGKERKTEDNHPLNTPNQRDKGEAQYHFNDATVQFFMKQLENLEVDSILCVGTPSLHQHVSNLTGKGVQGRLNTFLLDIDKRFIKLYKDGFALYNMCNHHFFHDHSKYSEFLRNSRKLAVVVDPPFGVKVELIWHGCLMGVHRDLMRLRKNSTEIAKSNNYKDLGFEVFWIFPYFNEGHILKCSDSRLQMSDFHVEYRNHTKYSGSETKSKPSPIRIFTTVPLSRLILSKKDYRHCNICEKWVDKQNMHCGLCGSCTTKDGGRTYQHCQKCAKCVKPTWKHCSSCNSCHLIGSPCKKKFPQGHNDAVVVNARKASSFRKDSNASMINQHGNRNVQHQKQKWKGNKNKK